jgi:ABC-2 type transport system permease protein
MSEQPMASTEAATLYDVRYSRYAGARESRLRSVLALTRSSTTRAVGLRRTTGAKVWPFLLIAAAHLPVVAAVGIPLLVTDAITPLEIMPFSQLPVVTISVVIAFAATTLPSLLTRERRDRVLSLYFSTALSPWEYLAGKVLSAIALMSLVTVSPLVLLLLGSIVTSATPLDALRDDGADILRVLAAGLVIAIHFTALGLIAGALTAKRIFAIGGLLAVLLVTPIVFNLVGELTRTYDLRAGDLATTPLRAADALLPGESAFEGGEGNPATAMVWSVVAGVVLLAGAVLSYRYRHEDAS